MNTSTNASRSEVHDYFDNPENYFHGDQHNLGIQIRQSIIRSFLKDRSVDKLLDLACGNGLMSLQFCDEIEEITLLDFSKSMLELAKKNTPPHNTSVSYVHGDIESAELTNSHFDVVLAIGLIAHVKSQARLVERLNELAAPGGLVIIQFTEGNHPWIKLIKRMRRQKNLIQKDSYALNHTVGTEIQAEFEKHGAHLVRKYRYEQFPAKPFKFLGKNFQQTFLRLLFGKPPRNRFGFAGSKCFYVFQKTSGTRVE